ncbi:MAG: hypothetical protein ABSF38_15840 [Verrucomicrobiota bacterium]
MWDACSRLVLMPLVVLMTPAVAAAAAVLVVLLLALVTVETVMMTLMTAPNSAGLLDVVWKLDFRASARTLSE